MGDLDIKAISKEDAEKLYSKDYDISLKFDGTLIVYKDKKLFSPRCERSDRYKHILDILKKSNFPDCMGEMFIDKPQSNVFDISRRENWHKACFLPFDLINTNLSYLQRMKILDDKVSGVNNPHIHRMVRFTTFKEGWDYVVKHQCEGLVIRNLRNQGTWYKCKLLQEIKVEIVSHIPSKVKGTFVLKNGSHISGTSAGFVDKFFDITRRKKKAIAEIEFPFLTKDGNYFQPRLRQITEVSL